MGKAQNFWTAPRTLETITDGLTDPQDLVLLLLLSLLLLMTMITLKSHDVLKLKQPSKTSCRTVLEHSYTFLC